MTVTTTVSSATFTTNGVTTAFPFGFKFIKNSDIQVTWVDAAGDSTPLTEGTSYSLTGAGAESGGTLTTTGSPLAAGTLTIERVLAPTQLTDLRNQGKYFAEVHEGVFDYLTMLYQQAASLFSRALVKPVGKNYYDAGGSNIKNLADPSDDQDAATKNWAQQYISSILATGQGPINNAANVVYVYPDGVARNVQSLSGKTGAYGIGWRERTVADRLNDTANVKDYGAIADGTLHTLSERFATLAAAQVVYPHATALTDSIDWAALVAAFNSGAAHVHAPEGWYVFNKGHAVNGRNVLLTGVYGSTKFDFSNSTSGLLISGSITQIQNLGASIAQYGRQIDFASAPSLAPGDVFIVYNPTDFSWLNEPGRASYRQGEFMRAHTISANTVYIYGHSTEGYIAANMQVYRLNGVRVKVEGIEFIPAATVDVPPLKVQFGNGVRIEDCFASTGGTYSGMVMERCYDVTIQNVTSVNNSPFVDNEYGVTISNCQKVTVTGGGNSATRHAIALGGGDYTCCVPCRHIQISDCTLENYGGAIGAADTHGNCDEVVYDNCIIRNGANMGGRNITYQNCIIYGVTSTAGYIIYGSEIVGGTFRVKNCRLVSTGDGSAQGYIHLSPSSAQRMYLKILVEDCILEAPGGTLSKAVYIAGRGVTFSTSVKVKGLHWEGASQALAFLYANDTISANFLSNYLICDDVYGPADTYLIYPEAKVATVPKREMAQSGYQDVTPIAGQANALAASSKTFRYKYSKMPTVKTGISSPSGTDLTTVGGLTPCVVANLLSATSIRMCVVSGTTGGWGASPSPVRLHYEVSNCDV